MESGELLGDRYRLVTQRGQGGTAVVWQARDEVLGREVAVKLLAPRLAGDTTLVDRLRAEAQAAAALHHPHVVTGYDFGEAPQPEGPPVPYVVLELVAGHSLLDALRSGPLPWPAALQTAAGVAAALAAAHAHGIVHRDVKLLESPIHEVRAGALSIMGKQAARKRTPEHRRKELYTFQLAEILLCDQHDLIHKVTGALLRTAGDQDRPRLLAFLDQHAAAMPRTTLRYAIEHLDPDLRKHHRSR